MFDRFKREIRAQKFFSTAEEAMYFEQAAKEVADGEIQPGLHAMALSKCEGDEVKAQAKYLQLRVDMLKQEAAVGEKIFESFKHQTREAEQGETSVETKWSGARPKHGWSEVLTIFALLALVFVVVALAEIYL